MSFLSRIQLLKMLLIISILLIQSTSEKKKGGMSPHERRLKNYREELKKTRCSHLTDEMNGMCVNYYISPECYHRAYGAAGLEFGEIDMRKDSDFNECFKKAEAARKK